jgi:ABC-type oligopeptide transport system ATPase subunit
MILKATGLSKDYVREGFLGNVLGRVTALRNIDFGIEKGDILGIIGESGSGKSTLAKIICGLEKPTFGELIWNIPETEYRYHPAQMVFQNPFNSLNPKLTVLHMLKEAVAYGENIRLSDVDVSDIENLIESVGLHKEDVYKYPHQFSGGQRQRIAIARALALDPHVLVCDEPVSALDISIQAQIINLLIEINKKMGLSIIFIAHDIEAVAVIAHNILVMKSGNIMEYGHKNKIINSPENSYTKFLIDSVPRNPWIR